jgi:hypothetical protein
MRKKDELSKKSCMTTAHPNEMVFTLIGRDPAAPVAIRAWVAERLRLGKNQETDAQITEALDIATTMEMEGRQWVNHPVHYPFGMGEESRRLHREYNRLVAEQRAGAKNGPEVVKLTDEAASKGITLVTGGEDL